MFTLTCLHLFTHKFFSSLVEYIFMLVIVVVVPPPTNKKHKLFFQSERREAKVFASFFSGTYCCWLDKEAGFPKMFI